MTDAVGDGSTSPSASNDARDGATITPVAATRLTVVHKIPEDAIELTAGDGTRFFAPPKANFTEVYTTGQANGSSLLNANSAVGHFGTFDFQRDGSIFWSAYSDTSNYAVGAYMTGAGYSLADTIWCGNFFCKGILLECRLASAGGLVDKNLARCYKRLHTNFHIAVTLVLAVKAKIASGPRGQHIILVVSNAIGLILYFRFATPLWTPRGQSDIGWGFAEGLSWAFTVFPWLLICFIINITIFRTVIARFILYNHWWSMVLLAILAILWIGAFEVDLSHH